MGRPCWVSEKEIRRASFSTGGKGRWSFSIEKDGLRLLKKEINEENNSKEDCFVEETGPKDTIEAQNSHSMDKKEVKEEADGDREHDQLECETAEKGGSESHRVA